MKNDIIQRLGHNEGRKKVILSLCRYVYVVLLLCFGYARYKLVWTTFDIHVATKQRTNQSVSKTIELSLRQAQFSTWRLQGRMLLVEKLKFMRILTNYYQKQFENILSYTTKPRCRRRRPPSVVRRSHCRHHY